MHIRQLKITGPVPPTTRPRVKTIRNMKSIGKLLLHVAVPLTQALCATQSKIRWCTEIPVRRLPAEHSNAKSLKPSLSVHEATTAHLHSKLNFACSMPPPGNARTRSKSFHSATRVEIFVRSNTAFGQQCSSSALTYARPKCNI